MLLKQLERLWRDKVLQIKSFQFPLVCFHKTAFSVEPLKVKRRAQQDGFDIRIIDTWGCSMRWRLVRRLFSVCLLGVCVAGELNAQTTSGELGGVVTDPSRAVVPDADVEIRDSAKGTTQSTKTDQQGVY